MRVSIFIHDGDCWFVGSLVRLFVLSQNLCSAVKVAVIVSVAWKWLVRSHEGCVTQLPFGWDTNRMVCVYCTDKVTSQDHPSSIEYSICQFMDISM